MLFKRTHIEVGLIAGLDEAAELDPLKLWLIILIFERRARVGINNNISQTRRFTCLIYNVATTPN